MCFHSWKRHKPCDKASHGERLTPQPTFRFNKTVCLQLIFLGSWLQIYWYEAFLFEFSDERLRNTLVDKVLWNLEHPSSDPQHQHQKLGVATQPCNPNCGQQTEERHALPGQHVCPISKIQVQKEPASKTKGGQGTGSPDKSACNANLRSIPGTPAGRRELSAKGCPLTSTHHGGHASICVHILDDK